MTRPSGADVLKTLRSIPAAELPPALAILRTHIPRHALTRRALAATVAAVDGSTLDLIAIQLWDEVFRAIDEGDPVAIGALEATAEAEEMLGGL
jgi:hypothetical protein